MSTRTNQPVSRRRTAWTSGRGAVAVVGVAIGVAYLLLGIARHEVVSGVIGFGIMVTYVALMYGLRHRYEPAQLLSGNPADERQAQIMQRATAFTGNVVIAAVLLGMLVSVAAGSHYATVFSGLAAVSGVAFVLGIIWFSRRS